ncbi:glycosyltransferase [Hazenella coriacea]|uniref:Glycosyltransferase involved in cell wall biosynthesis n=1 Tax=Hazenella coriacea TaxID=1179467 RepID=A0A4V2UUV6_9BACL|nr:glycosyltransferase [Hazenella coriacea]TCS93257.1 glycosyltransferase involved in cell wall biosynthesis [Hazenella coriacea]
MKILLFAASNSIHTHKWALFYQRQGIEVKVVTFADHFSQKHAEEVPTLALPKLLPGKLSYPTSLFALKKILANEQPDIFHAHYVSSYGFLAALTKYKPLVVSVWGTDIYQFPTKGRLNRYMVQTALSKADLICSTSEDMARETSKYTSKSMEITPFGVDTKWFRPLGLVKSNEIVTIGIAKGLHEVYGISKLIQAFAEVEKIYPQVRLLIVGDGPKRNEYEELTRSLGVEHKVSFTGRVPNSEVVHYMNQMDIFVLPSYSESFGVAAIEAQACGVPVIVTQVGGLPEVVEDGETGIIIPNNEPKHLVPALERLIQDPELRLRMGEAGAHHVRQEYDWEENANRMLQLYGKVWGQEKIVQTI